MSEHIALYRKWRPLTFSDVVGQEHITRTLQNEIISKNTGHAFLFCGGRGTGKTTTARILSRALNCLSPINGDPCNECESCRGILSGEIMDIAEIDAASNNGVENIRELRSDARFAAASARCKVYIIDEVHMLSQGAFNALLKLLEEPPEGVVFILATTETQKVPLTIISRCQRFDFKRITAADIARRILYVSGEEGIKITEGAASVLARAADGALRDALGLLDQCRAASDDEITEKTVSSVLGLTEKTFLYRVARRIADCDTAEALSLADEFISTGKSPARFIDAFIDYFSSLLRYKVSKTAFSDCTESEKEELMLASDVLTTERMLYAVDTLTKTAQSLKFTASGRVLLDTALIKLCMPEYAEGEEALALRVAELEKKMENGFVASERTQERKASDTKADTASTASIRKERKKAPLTGEFRQIEEKWSEICRGTENLRLLIALEKCSVREDKGELALVFDDTDSIMIDILSGDETKEALADLIERYTGLRPGIKLRLAGFYETAEGDGPEDDPMNAIDFSDSASEDGEKDENGENEENEESEENEGFDFEEKDDEPEEL